MAEPSSNPSSHASHPNNLGVGHWDFGSEPPRHPWPWRHILLFLLTVASTILVGAEHYASFYMDFGNQSLVELSWAGLVLSGLWYSASILAILGAHEFGHYYACRYYGVDASLPYFL